MTEDLVLPVIVIDIPENASAADAAQALNAPGADYFIVQVLPIAGGHRAYLRRYKQPPVKSGAANETTWNGGPKANQDGNQDAAYAVIRQHPTLSGERMSEKLKDLGIQRSSNWVLKHKPIALRVTRGEA